MRAITTAHGELALPVFFPDATRAVVRSVDSRDLAACGVTGLVVNTFHLMSRPGAGLIKSLGGVHRFMGWQRPVASDSGGFQLMSMIRANPRYGTISERGIHFTHIDRGGDRVRFTPEKSMQVQFDLAADIMICLDDCPGPEASLAEVAESVGRTVSWARRCRAEFDRLLAVGRRDGGARPPRGGVIQGGFDPHWRAECAAALREIGFDGYGFGGWPLDAQGKLAEEILALTARLMPDDLPKFALGVGKPENIVRGFQMGYRIFDCVLPTRDARHGRLYAFSSPHSDGIDVFQADFYRLVYPRDKKHKRDARPISELCDCPCCRDYSLGYLHHLFEIGDALALRLATLHNLSFYNRLMDRLRRSLARGSENGLGGHTDE
ncbi:MAG: tRNA guanosine(34) transglycosylase Tgt [Chloroflexota bacterium]